MIVLALSSHRLFFLKDAFTRLALGLVLGGTTGNLIDRFARGYVTDFIDFKVWPAFNVADLSITVGAIIIAYALLQLTKEAKN